ncbi:hypothetical protein [Lacticaseibacillus songhuajiangensis]|uniref:hypothetical protein n=1 Tax=Lacticaseibacillus songhuajiangensis TaxID=1296539 RepID=UPI000F7AB297|nr:hypothetical protein [Lacticaseibacillus songhuajiangensis]
MKKKSVLGLVLTVSSVVLLAACGANRKTSSSNGASQTSKTALTIQNKTYVGKQKGNAYEVSLASDGTFTAKISDYVQKNIQLRTGTYKLNKQKNKASFSVEKVATATFPNESETNNDKAPLTVSKQEDKTKLTGSQAKMAQLMVSGSQLKLESTTMKVRKRNVQSYADFYQTEQNNYNDSYGLLGTSYFNAMNTETDAKPYLAVLNFNGNHFSWMGEPVAKKTGTIDVEYAEGTFVFNTEKQQLELKTTAKTPLYIDATGTDHPERNKTYSSTGSNTFGNSVVVSVEHVGNDVKLSCDNPDFGTYKIDKTESKSDNQQSVATIQSKYSKKKTVTDIFPNADSFMRFVEQEQAKGESKDDVSAYSVETNQPLGNLDGSDVNMLYLVTFSYAPGGDPANGAHAETIGITSDGTVYDGTLAMTSGVNQEMTNDVQQMLN